MVLQLVSIVVWGQSCQCVCPRHRIEPAFTLQNYQCYYYYGPLCTWIESMASLNVSHGENGTDLRCVPYIHYNMWPNTSGWGWCRQLWFFSTVKNFHLGGTKSKNIFGLNIIYTFYTLGYVDQLTGGMVNIGKSSRW